jgi:hypothetical protein
MLKKGYLILSAILLIVNLTAKIVTATEIPYIQEQFDSQSNFTAIKGGTWRVTNGRYVLSNPASAQSGNANISVHNKPLTNHPFPIVPEVFDLKVDASARPTAGSTDSFSIIFTYKDVDNYAYASFSETNTATTNGIFKVTNGVAAELTDFTATTPAGDLNNIKILKRGSTADVWLGGSLIGSVTDPSFVNSKIGFGTLNNEAEFDNLHVSFYGTGTPTPTPVPFLPPPQDLKVTPGTANCFEVQTWPVFEWKPVVGATSYNIKISATKGGPYRTIATNITGTSYGGHFVRYVVVTAVNALGESLPSNEVEATYKKVLLFCPPEIDSISQVAGPIGTKITLIGKEFYPSQYGSYGAYPVVAFGPGIISDYKWTSEEITFEIKDSICPSGTSTEPCIPITPQVYDISVSNQFGRSNVVKFTVTPSVSLFTENFDKELNHFTSIRGGDWSTVNGQYVLKNAATNRKPLGNISLHDVSLNSTFMMTVDAGAQAREGAWDDFAIIFNYQNEKNYYYASFNESNNNTTHGLFKVVNGTVTELVNFPGRIQGGKLYKVSIFKSGTSINISLYDPSLNRLGPVIKATVEDGTFNGGRIGVGTYNNNAFFDNLFVSTGSRMRLPSHDNGEYNVTGVKLYDVKYATEDKTKVNITLINTTGGWYIGAWDYILWIGDTKIMNSCVPEESNPRLKCYSVSAEVWEGIKQGELMKIVWRDVPEDRRNVLPFGVLNQKP